MSIFSLFLVFSLAISLVVAVIVAVVPTPTRARLLIGFLVPMLLGGVVLPPALLVFLVEERHL